MVPWSDDTEGERILPTDQKRGPAVGTAVEGASVDHLHPLGLLEPHPCPARAAWGVKRSLPGPHRTTLHAAGLPRLCGTGQCSIAAASDPGQTSVSQGA